MKKRSILLFSTALALLALMVLVGISTKKSDKRQIHEQFLLKSYQEMDQTLGLSSDKPDNPDLAAFQNYFMTIDPEEKRVPFEKLVDAYKYKKELSSSLRTKSETTAIEWTETGSNMGGRTRAIMYDPNDINGNKVWAGGVTGGLWYNNDITNDNSSWLAVNDYWPNLSVSSITYDPNEPMTFYVGTGEYQTARHIYRESSGVGIGIWKSTDGGDSWNILSSTEEWKYISDIKVRDENGVSAIYAGVVSGFYHGINHQSEPSDGLYRSIDGGATWEQILPNIAGEDVPYAPADLDLGPEGRIFVGTMKNLAGDGGASILYSDLGIQGSWTVYDDYETIIELDPSYPVPGRVIIACSPSDVNRVYALVGAGWIDNMGGNRAEGRYILKSTDGGDSWSTTNLPGGDTDWASLSWHAFIGSVNPSDPDDVFVGGLDVWKTSNGGNNWNHLSDWSLMYNGGGDDYVHADQHVQLYKEGSSTEMMLGSDGGIFYTGNANSTNPIFEEKNKNYSTLQFYSCDIYPVPGMNYFVGGLQDNGTLLYMGDPLDINDMIDGGDGAYCFFDKNEPPIMITSTYYNSYTLFMNWNYYDDFGDYGTGVFVNPADYDSENNILYANGVTFTGGNSNSLLRVSGIPNNPYDQLVNINAGVNVYFSQVKVSPYAPDGSSTLFVGSQDGRLFKVTNAQATPSISEIGSGDFPTAYLSSIDVGGSEDTLVVTFSNYGVPSVWQTYDGGVVWTDISGNLPDMPIRWAIYHPQNSQQIMLATEIGIWTTKAAGAEEVIWEPDIIMPNVRVDMLQMRDIDNTVVAATHGRGLIYGVWEYDTSTSISENESVISRIFPNPSQGLFNIALNAKEDLAVIITDVNGRIVYEEIVGKTNGRMELECDLSHEVKGVYLVSVMSEGKNYTEKIVLN